MGKFTATIDVFVARNSKVLRAIQNESVEEVIRRAQLSDDKGGRMRVDTGFLRASGQISINGMPTGPSRKPSDAMKNDPRYEFTASPIILALATAPMGAEIHFGWTANYARYREYKDGFLRVAVQQWPSIVDQVTADLKRRIKR